MSLLVASLTQAKETDAITATPTESASAQKIVEINPPTTQTPPQDKPKSSARFRPTGRMRSNCSRAKWPSSIRRKPNGWFLKHPHSHTLADLYLEGGYEWTTAITLCLIALLFAAWKAPRWVKEFGLLAMIIGFLSMMVGFYSVASFVQASGYPVSFTLLCGGLRVAFICPIYGMIVHGISLILRIVLKPRI